MQTKYSIGIIGSGNIAWNLGNEINKHFPIAFVHSRNVKEGKSLSKQLGAEFKHPNNFQKNIDILFVCLPDDAIVNYLITLENRPKLIVHTSGSTSMDVLRKFSDLCGVMYPVQTISKNITLDWATIPICIEGNSVKSIKIVQEISKSISKNVIKMDSAKRLRLHLATLHF